jgi:hypothetical protein
MILEGACVYLHRWSSMARAALRIREPSSFAAVRKKLWQRLGASNTEEPSKPLPRSDGAW